MLYEVLRFENAHQVLLHRQSPEDGGLLGQVADTAASSLMHGHQGDVLVVDADAAAVLGYQADNHVERGGFAA